LNRAVDHSGQLRRVFNAGAGEGGYSPLLLAMRGVESVIETDVGYGAQSPRRIDAKQLHFGSSLVSIPMAKQTIDLVLCTEVLEHIEDHEKALDEIARILISGGWLLITVPTPPAPFDPAHVREGYRIADLSTMLKQRGFEIVETRFCMHYFFKFLLANWSHWKWHPRIAIRVLSFLDKLLPVGSPMDLVMLAVLK
jgi:SAM-dependent methyltransferase